MLTKNVVAAEVRKARLTSVATAALALMVGCNTSERPSPGPRLGPVEQIDRGGSVHYAYKPLPGPESGEPPVPPFSDPPLIYQRPPEQQAFVDAYNAVRRPKLAIFVNRSLLGDGQPVEAASADPPPATGADPVGDNPFRGGGGGGGGRPDPNVRPGVYDEAHAKQIDYATIETVLTQWLAADGQTTILSPSAVRERLSPDEVRKLQDGRPRMVGELVKELSADVLVHVQARPTRQTERGLEVRLNAEAINIQGGEQIARATVLIPPPLDTEKVNRFTRFVARKLMADMAMTWSGPGPDAGRPAPANSPGGPGGAPPPTRPAGPPPINPSDAPPPPAPSGGETSAPGPVVEVSPAPDRQIPQERPSMLDRPADAPSRPQQPVPPEPPPPAVGKPAADFPPPPASSNRQDG